MNSRLGTYVPIKIPGESYKAYIPALLPPDPPVQLEKHSGLLEQAATALAELNQITRTIPNLSLFTYMFVRKEALISSQIEGTQSSFSDLILFENNQQPNVVLEDIEEVSSYVKSINYGLNRIHDGFPLSLRLLREMHAILLATGRGANRLPGEFRKTQNWIGGTRPGNALFVPPSIHYLNDCVSNFESFLHDSSLPVLVKAAIAHVQFETIHPFLDGNGRVGRLLVTLLLMMDGLLEQPVLYLSLYLKENRNIYYQLLQEVRTKGAWEEWVEFFLMGILYSSKQAIRATEDINGLFKKDSEVISSMGRIKFSCEKTLEHLKKVPQVFAILLAKEMNMSVPTARNVLNSMVKMGIVDEVTGKKRDKIYLYRKYLNLLEKGTKPLN